MKLKSKRIMSLLVVLTTIISLLLVSSSIASTEQVSPLTLGKAALAHKNYSVSIKYFASAVAQDPTSCECRLLHGKALCKLASILQKCSKQTDLYKQGISELRKSIRFGRGSRNAIEANAILLTLPKSLITPKTAPSIATINRISKHKPKILEFYATWCEPCKMLNPIIDKARSDYGDRIDFISYDVDDPSSEKIMEDYEISPIPTLVFLDSTSKVSSYSIGFAGVESVQAGIKKILPR